MYTRIPGVSSVSVYGTVLGAKGMCKWMGQASE